MALMYSKGMEQGTLIPPFDLPSVDGQRRTVDSFSGARALVVVFTCNHCPYAIACEDRLIALQHAYDGSQLQMVLINPNDSERYPDDSFEAMVVRAKEKSFPFPYLHDADQTIARAFDAACTPDIFLFDEARKLVYNGRLDDNWQDPSRVARQELKEAIDATLSKSELSFEVKPSMGCSIKWKP